MGHDVFYFVHFWMTLHFLLLLGGAVFHEIMQTHPILIMCCLYVFMRLFFWLVFDILDWLSDLFFRCCIFVRF